MPVGLSPTKNRPDASLDRESAGKHDFLSPDGQGLASQACHLWCPLEGPSVEAVRGHLATEPAAAVSGDELGSALECAEGRVRARR